MLISIDAECTSDKSQYLFFKNTCVKLEMQGIFLSLTMALVKNLVAHVKH